jgi:hypothetical protein
MRPFILACFGFLLTASVAVPAQAGETLTVVADSTYSGNDGFVVESVEDESFGVSIFVGIDAGKVRIYAFRDFGSQIWDDVGDPQYLVPSATLNIGDTWRFVDSDDGNETEAEVMALENITVVAGTFSAYRVDIIETNAPNDLYETMWFANGIGFVRSQGFLNGEVDWTDDLATYSIVGGGGFFPLAVGNTWDIVYGIVSTERGTWGGAKALYR